MMLAASLSCCEALPFIRLWYLSLYYHSKNLKLSWPGYWNDNFSYMLLHADVRCVCRQKTVQLKIWVQLAQHLHYTGDSFQSWKTTLRRGVWRHRHLQYTGSCKNKVLLALRQARRDMFRYERKEQQQKFPLPSEKVFVLSFLC